MPFIYFLTSVSLLASLFSNREINGNIITKTDTLQVRFLIPYELLCNNPDFERLQNKIIYFDISGEKKKLRPNDALAIEFDHYKMVSVENTYNLGNPFTTNDSIFLKVEVDGPVKLLKYYFSRTNNNSTYPNLPLQSQTVIPISYRIQTSFLQKGNGPIIKAYRFGFKKDLTLDFRDCPELVQKIETKEYSYSDLPIIVQYYNNWTQEHPQPNTPPRQSYQRHN